MTNKERSGMTVLGLLSILTAPSLAAQAMMSLCRAPLDKLRQLLERLSWGRWRTTQARSVAHYSPLARRWLLGFAVVVAGVCGHLPQAQATASWSVLTDTLVACVPTAVLRADVSYNGTQYAAYNMTDPWPAGTDGNFRSTSFGPQLYSLLQNDRSWDFMGADWLLVEYFSLGTITIPGIDDQPEITAGGCGPLGGGWVAINKEGVVVKVVANSEWSIVGNDCSTGCGVALQYQSGSLDITENGTYTWKNSSGIGSHTCVNSASCALFWPAVQSDALPSNPDAYWTHTGAPGQAEFIYSRGMDGQYIARYDQAKDIGGIRTTWRATYTVMMAYVPGFGSGAKTSVLRGAAFGTMAEPRKALAQSQKVIAPIIHSPAVTLSLRSAPPQCSLNVDQTSISAGTKAIPAQGAMPIPIGRSRVDVTCTHGPNGIDAYKPGVVFADATAVPAAPQYLSTTTQGLAVIGRSSAQPWRACGVTPDEDDVLFDSVTPYRPSDKSMDMSLPATPGASVTAGTTIDWGLCATGAQAPIAGPFKARASYSLVLQ